MTNLKYENIEIQTYLTSAKIYPQLAKQIFKWRTRMVNFKMNFKKGSESILCPLGCLQIDSQAKILNCPILKVYLPELLSTNIQYENIFSKSINKIRETTELLNEALTKREELIAAVVTMRAQAQDKKNKPSKK